MSLLLVCFLLLSGRAFSQKSTSNLWCIKESQPEYFNYNATLTYISTYNQVHCSRLCNVSTTCDMFTYFYNYTCLMYDKYAINSFVYKYHQETWASCIMNNISTLASAIGTSNAKYLNITDNNMLCILNYNTVGTNIQTIPPEPPFSPPNISICSQKCVNTDLCSFIIFQPIYKEMNVTACWFKNDLSHGLSGETGIDTETLASCFRNVSEYLALGYDEAGEFQYIIPVTKSNASNVVYDIFLIMILVLLVYFIIFPLS